MKKVLYFFFVFSSLICYSQEVGDPLFAYTSNNLNVIPVSPEAASFGKISDVPVNLATGRMNYVIPLYLINTKGYSFPINLTYSYSGLKVNEIPTSVGLGWSLSAGGTISRQVRGKPDESQSYGYVATNYGINNVIPFLFGDWNSLPYSERKVKKYLLFRNAEENYFDTKPDKFSININNVSTNFFYNEFGTPIIVPYKNYKIDKLNGYEIIDDTGIKYIFNETEMSSSEIFFGGGSSFTMPYVAAWHISEIQLPTGESIYFEYDTIQFRNKTHSRSKSYPPYPFSGYPGDPRRSTESSVVSVSTIDRKQIKKITFPNGYLDFSYTIMYDYDIDNKVSLDSCNIYIKDCINGHYKKNKTYVFKYNDKENVYKVLKQIQYFDKDYMRLPFYNFEYYDENISNDIKYSDQDFWGFYNMKNNGSYHFSNERGVNFNATQKGALKKIIYPTGGYSEINYEQNLMDNLSDAFLLRNGSSKCPDLIQFDNYESFSSTGPGVEYYTLAIKANQFVRVDMSSTCSVISGDNSSSISVNFSVMTPSLLDCSHNSWGLSTSCIQSGIPDPNDPPPPPPTSSEMTSSESIYFYNPVDQDITIKMITDFHGVSEVSGGIYYNDEIQSYYAGGIRIKETKKCNEENDCISKQYNYVNENGRTSGKLLIEPVYQYNTFVSTPFGSVNKINESMNSKVSFSGYLGNSVLYDRVEVNWNNSSEKGKIIQSFTTIDNQLVNIFPFAERDLKFWKLGLPLQKIYKKLEDGVFVKEREENNNYVTNYPFGIGADNIDYMRSYGLYAGRNSFEYTFSGGEFFLPNYQDPNIFSERSNNNTPETYLLSTSNSVYYYENQSVKDSVVYNYDIPHNQIISKIKINSNGIYSKTEYEYPYNSNVSGANYLVEANMIKNPIKTSNYVSYDAGVNYEKVSEKYTEYDITTTGIPILKKIKESKGTNNLEEVMIFNKHDENNGNPLEIIQPNGIYTCYIWGYNHTQPIAKISNATWSEVQSHVTNLQLLSNQDDDRTIGSAGNEGVLRISLNNLRNALPNAQVTTYTYDPLIGVTSITQPNGETVYYEYDNFNRLQFIKDANGNILKENEYHYRE